MLAKNCLLYKKQHKEASIAAFENLLNDVDFTDVTLVCSENKQVSVHKVILSTCSPFFKNILLKNPHKYILIYLNGISHRDLTSIIEFMYLGQTKVSKEGLETFLLAAQELQVEGLAFEGVDIEETSMKQVFSQCEEIGRLHERNIEERVQEDQKLWERERVEGVVRSVNQDLKPPGNVFKRKKEEDQVVDIQKEQINLVEISDKSVSSQEGISQLELVESVDVKAESSETNYNYLVPEETIDESINEKKHSTVGSTCLECGKRLKSRNINRHIQEKHQGRKEEPCALCGKIYTRQEAKDQHLCRSDPILYPFKCFECNLRLLSQKKLDRHNKNRSKLCYHSNFSLLRRFKYHKLDNCKKT